LSYLTEDSLKVRALPPETKPRCEGACPLLIVEITDRIATWRCRRCLRYITKSLVSATGQGSLF
jgi:hypothetical protein